MLALWHSLCTPYVHRSNFVFFSMTLFYSYRSDFSSLIYMSVGIIFCTNTE